MERNCLTLNLAYCQQLCKLTQLQQLLKQVQKVTERVQQQNNSANRNGPRSIPKPFVDDTDEDSIDVHQWLVQELNRLREIAARKQSQVKQLETKKAKYQKEIDQKRQELNQLQDKYNNKQHQPKKK